MHNIRHHEIRTFNDTSKCFQDFVNANSFLNIAMMHLIYLYMTEIQLNGRKLPADDHLSTDQSPSILSSLNSYSINVTGLDITLAISKELLQPPSVQTHVNEASSTPRPYFACLQH